MDSLRQSEIISFREPYNQKLDLEEFPTTAFFIKRIDLIHPEISGNKYFKLKYNVDFALKNHYEALLNFGGAHSNHIAALAAFGKYARLQTIGVIRGEELAEKIADIPTLKNAQKAGMKLIFVSRADYKNRHSDSYIKSLLVHAPEKTLVIPEGGSNRLAIKGCQEILTPHDACFDVICCAVGTGGTLAGLANSLLPHQHLLGFSALKPAFTSDGIKAFIKNENYELFAEDRFGGYGKINETLTAFINNFYKRTGIPLDPIYTGKMLFKIFGLAGEKYFYEKKVLIVHSGGLQGISAANKRMANASASIIYNKN